MRFVNGEFYLYGGNNLIRKSSGATRETLWECVAVGARWALLYFDGRKCDTKETTVAVEHGDVLWKKA
jgi:hypothetical protein